MNKIQYSVFVLGAIALIALFLMLPEAPGIGCTACSSNDPYIPLIGAGYFSLLIAFSLLFPSYPKRVFARCGLLWSIFLAVAMTYIHMPSWCPLCLLGHVCNILIWAIWTWGQSAKIETSSASLSERVCLACFVPVAVVALFGTLNLTFMVYGFQLSRPVLSAGLLPGDEAPPFTMKTIEGRTISSAEVISEGGIVLNFVSANCPYCKELMQEINGVLEQLGTRSFRLVNVSSVVLPEWSRFPFLTEWVEDQRGEIRRLFTVSGYPTLITIGADGKIGRIIAGVPDEAKSTLLGVFSKLTNQNTQGKEQQNAQSNLPSGNVLTIESMSMEISPGPDK